VRLHTTVYLIRNAQTAWNVERRLAGRRELLLSDEGRRTADSLVERFSGIQLDEILASPLPRTVETAQPLALAQKLELARDPRLSDWQPGEWEGKTYSEITAEPLYQQMVDRTSQAALDELSLPGGERFGDVVARMQASIDQALCDNEMGASIAVVSHAGPLRLLLSHYLSVPPWEHERLRLEPGSVTILRFGSHSSPPSLVAINTLGRVLDSVGTAR
jgi:broad specificity phosphatase PhoE